MNNQLHALYALIESGKLSQTEVVGLTLGDLNLAGNNPEVKVWDEETGQRRSIAIDVQMRDILVTWLLARPDRPTTLFFPGENDEGLTPADIDSLLADFTPPPSKTPPPAPIVTSQIIVEEELPDLGPLPSKQAPLPFKVAQPPAARPEKIGDVPDTSPPVPIKPNVESKAEATASSPPQPAYVAKPQTPARRFGAAAIAIAVLLLLACGGLTLGGIFIARDQIAKLRGEETPLAAAATASAENTPAELQSTPVLETPVIEQLSPLPTPPPPVIEKPASPVETPTPEATPLPAETPTLLPTQTPTAAPTGTETPQATATPTLRAANTPTAENQPATPPTAGFKYAAPELISPEQDFAFISGNTIDLKWEAVGELAGNEQYAIRLIYAHNAEVVYRGNQLKETQWTVPFEFFRDADGPEFLYTWYVYVEEVQPDGTGIAISPESERRNFTWK